MKRSLALPTRPESPVSSIDDEGRLEAFDYPEDWVRIADHPSPIRDEARLLVYERRPGRLTHRRFRDLPEYCDAGDAVVLNDSRVIPARLDGIKTPSGGRIEFLLVRRIGPGVWIALAKGGARPGQRVAFAEGGEGEITRAEGAGRVRLALQPDDAAWLDRVGRVPLPPYIRRPASIDSCDDDRERYQTVFAASDGSVAAPTAGLHFTHDVLHRLRDQGVGVATVTLHVGPGTFEPIRTARVEDHPMASEWGDLSDEAAQAVNTARESNRRILAVGTTATRVLETAASPEGRLSPWSGETSLFIRPGYAWKVVDALLTNFHLPRSTPLLLASAFCGRSVLWDLYREAAREGYRFYSYGDAMLIL